MGKSFRFIYRLPPSLHHLANDEPHSRGVTDSVSLTCHLEYSPHLVHFEFHSRVGYSVLLTGCLQAPHHLVHGKTNPHGEETGIGELFPSTNTSSHHITWHMASLTQTGWEGAVLFHSPVVSNPKNRMYILT